AVGLVEAGQVGPRARGGALAEGVEAADGPDGAVAVGGARVLRVAAAGGVLALRKVGTRGGGRGIGRKGVRLAQRHEGHPRHVGAWRATDAPRPAAAGVLLAR